MGVDHARQHEAARDVDGLARGAGQVPADRRDAADIRQGSGPGGTASEPTVNGMSVEYMVQLANDLDADPWFNMPHLADDTFVRNFATHVRDHLDALFERGDEHEDARPAPRPRDAQIDERRLGGALDAARAASRGATIMVEKSNGDMIANPIFHEIRQREKALQTWLRQIGLQTTPERANSTNGGGKSASSIGDEKVSDNVRKLIG